MNPNLYSQNPDDNINISDPYYDLESFKKAGLLAITELVSYDQESINNYNHKNKPLSAGILPQSIYPFKLEDNIYTDHFEKIDENFYLDPPVNETSTTAYKTFFHEHLKGNDNPALLLNLSGMNLSRKGLINPNSKPPVEGTPGVFMGMAPSAEPLYKSELVDLHEATQAASMVIPIPFESNKVEKEPEAKPPVPEIDGIQRFTKQAPVFAEQMLDTSRSNLIEYHGEDATDDSNKKTEQESLAGLQEFLMEFAANPGVIPEDNGVPDQTYVNLVQTAQSMLETLTFIGKKEYDEAVQGIGQLWKDYLDSDDSNRLCVPLAITTSHAYRKSDTYLFESILSTFSEEELVRYSGRITKDIDDITGEPEHLRIILLDDWTISGTQMKSSYRTVRDKIPDKYGACFRVNLIAASEDHLENGIKIDGLWGGNSTQLPVEAYFRAHTAQRSGYGTHITGSHSSVDYDFQNDIQNMRNRLNRITDSTDDGSPKVEVGMPPLTKIIRTYRTSEPAIVIEDDGRIRKNISN